MVQQRYDKLRHAREHHRAKLLCRTYLRLFRDKQYLSDAARRHKQLRKLHFAVGMHRGFELLLVLRLRHRRQLLLLLLPINVARDRDDLSGRSVLEWQCMRSDDFRR